MAEVIVIHLCMQNLLPYMYSLSYTPNNTHSHCVCCACARRFLTMDKVQLLGNQKSIYGSKLLSFKTCGHGRSHCNTLVYTKSVTIHVFFVIYCWLTMLLFCYVPLIITWCQWFDFLKVFQWIEQLYEQSEWIE